MLISIHIPKTAGSSFKEILSRTFGDGLLLDYSDRPANQSQIERTGSAFLQSFGVATKRMPASVACIHGHFLPFKYRWLSSDSPVQFVTWMRDPVERVVSHYYYWRRDYNPVTAGKLRRQMMEESWSLEEFCFSKPMRNIYSSFFWGFPSQRFSFIGVVENYESDLAWFSEKFLQAETHGTTVNVNPEREGDRYDLDPQLRRKLEEFHALDMRLYRNVLDASSARIYAPRTRTFS